jgi:hypothetical protein
MLLFIASGALAQNLFELDLESGHIYEFAPNGAQSTFFSGLVLPGPESSPSWLMCFDSSGNLFVSSSTNILKITPSGYTNIFATGIYTWGLAFNSAGDLFVSDNSSNNIYEYTPEGARSTFVTGLNRPAGLAFDSQGNLFAADQGSSHIYEFTNDNGILSTNPTIFASGLDFPFGLAFNSVGDLFESDYLSGHIYEFATNGEQSIFASNLDAPVGLAFNDAGTLFEADSLSHNIFEFTTNGVQSTFASNLDEPTGLAFQPVPQLLGTSANGAFQLTVTMPSPYYSTILEVSTDLVNWSAICTNTPPFVFTDSMATGLPRRFYRAQLVP